MIQDPPLRTIPGDWPSLVAALNRAYEAGREAQFKRSNFVLAAVIKAIGGKVSFHMPVELTGALIQTASDNGMVVTLEYIEAHHEEGKDQELRPQLRQVWSADGRDSRSGEAGRHQAQGVPQDAESDDT